MKDLLSFVSGLCQTCRRQLSIQNPCKRPFSSTTTRPGLLGLDRKDLREKQNIRRKRAKKLHRYHLWQQKQGLRKPPPAIYAPPRSARNYCKDPIAALTSIQLNALDPNGVRARLFAQQNRDSAKVGDILLVRLKGGDTFAGVCLNIRKQGVDTAILLRNQLTRVGVEMWYKIYSPLVEGIEVVQRKAKRARRARLYYMRKPKHDLGSVENIVNQYKRQRQALRSGQSKGRDSNANKRQHAKSK